MFTFFAFLVTFSALVLVHELGHFFAARLRGVRVEEFGFGFPPRLLAKTIGETMYTINLIPLGGFVKLYGESESAAAKSGSFASRSFSEKLFIVLAGVGSNLLFAVVSLSILLSVGTTQPMTHLYPKAIIKNPRVIVTQILPKSPAQIAGLKAGDILEALNGDTVANPTALSQLLSDLLGQSVAMDIVRGKERMRILATPEKLEAVGGRVALGIGLDMIATVSYPVVLAPAYAVAESWYLGKEMLRVLGSFLSKLFISHTTKDLGVTGPIGIAVMSGQVARMGLSSFLYFLALLSLNLALLNVLPLPALDGGRAAIIIGERIAGRAIHQKLEHAIQLVGVVLILSLALLVTVQDFKVFGPMFASAFGVK